jgi:hypothetical protein
MSNITDEVIDLDVLRPSRRTIKLSGKSIDVSFIPCGINFEIDALMKELSKIDPVKAVESDTDECKQAFNLGIKICSTFCSHSYPEMTSEWFYEHTSSGQILVFVNAVKQALVQAYKGIGEHSKNGEAAQVMEE